MQRASICHGSDIFKKRVGSFCWHIWMSRYSLLAFAVTSLGMLLASCPVWGHLLLWSHKNVCWPSFAHPHRRITDQRKGFCWLPPSLLLLSFFLMHPLASPWFFSLSTPPPGLRLGTCGPLPHLNFFTPPPFGRTPDALTQSRLSAWEGVCFSLRVRRYTCICVWDWGSIFNYTHPHAAKKARQRLKLLNRAEQQIRLWTWGDWTFTALTSNLQRLLLHYSMLLPASHLHSLLPCFNSLFVVTQTGCAIHSDVILLVKRDFNSLAPAL